MGYSEIYCALCGISFNMARIRTADEPEEAAWSTYGPAGWINPLGRDNVECSTEETGCFYVIRNCEWFKHGVSEGMKSDLWRIMFFDYEPGKLPRVGDRLPMAEPVMELAGRIGLDKADLEHVAGPGCSLGDGYLGHRISLEEMRYCQTAQGLALKQDGWQPQLDDHPVELQSKYFLTGLVDGMPDIEIGLTGCYDEEYNHPSFHPSCFAIFMKLSRLRFGHVEIDGLMDYFAFIGGQGHEPAEELMDPDAAKSIDQWWNHIPGAEWLAVNPLYVPRLREIFKQAMDTEPTFSQQDSVFKAPSLPGSSSDNTSDPFSRLPPELRTMILGGLDAKDIASLRLASRTFYDLPASLFHKLIKEEMPWLWEIWDNEPPYFWATVTELDIRASGIMERSDDGDRAIGHNIDVQEHLRQWTLPIPPASTTNWYIIYRDIKKHWIDLKGLRNRRRIWISQGAILDEMAKFLKGLA
ncbi:hypothetical protein N8T08_005167 [Aspergillus melleus]|uniref:Uncharacterized protein n=1 Tax=Aspergillus melleus TaxID=138277 RepID=A0ACC3BG31_9EURO|nr:hypothetical protein N8T08_005167 [Aspergillus melleus]